MSIEQIGEIDAIGINNLTGNVVLTIIDHFEWINNDSEHLNLLQEKLNSYLKFVESGEIFEAYPNAKNRVITIEVVYKYQPVEKAFIFYNQVESIIENAGIKFSHRLLLEPN